MNDAMATTLGVVFEREHFVQFYEQEELLLKNIKSFIGAAVRHGDSAIVICTPVHKTALESLFVQENIDIHTASFIWLDAEETLAQFMVDGWPNRELFRKTIGGVLAKASKKNRPVRAFGEMVALLVAQGNKAGAIHLEKFWNEIAYDHSLTLFCAYPMHCFDCRDSFEEISKEIRHQHSSAIAPNPSLHFELSP